MKLGGTLKLVPLMMFIWDYPLKKLWLLFVRSFILFHGNTLCHTGHLNSDTLTKLHEEIFSHLRYSLESST